MWQAVTSIAALTTALVGAGLGVAGFLRSARSEDARQQAEQARGRADAAGVGLTYLEKALAAQGATITRQEGEIGELRGQLKECRTERHVMAQQLEAQAVQMEAQAAQIAALEERMA